jgi:hypothetical protein
MSVASGAREFDSASHVASAGRASDFRTVARMADIEDLRFDRAAGKSEA